MSRPSPLPNRIDPFGAAHAVTAKGGWTGNRGPIHDGWRIVRRAATDGWVCCLLHFQNRRRVVMTPNRWTELFFLDEATAFAAGHRPCFFCRRRDAQHFAAAWGAGADLGRAARAPEMDAVLKTERRHAGRLRPGEVRALRRELPPAPDVIPRGAMVATDVGGDAPTAFIWTGARFLRWSFDGYAPGDPAGEARLLTPPSVVAAFRAGYAPQLHPSADRP